METLNCDVNLNSIITKEDVDIIVANDANASNDFEALNYSIYNASNKMLGFLADYWKLKVVVSNGKEKKILCYFIKAISITNAAKAAMVTQFNLFDKELYFYSSVKEALRFTGLKPWSAELISTPKDAMVFQDLNALNYKLRNMFQRFDMAHTLQALRTLSRFHASTIIYEERKMKELKRPFTIRQEFRKISGTCGYNGSSSWFLQCKQGALEALKTFSKYRNNPQLMRDIDNQWSSIWSTALRLSEHSSHRNVICHCDLWNNNLLFHYENGTEPNDCLFVDFQAVSCQPPAGDVMLLLYCNLEPKFREENLQTFLEYYHQELGNVLANFEICLENIMPLQVFMESAEEQRVWGLVACACLMPQFWLDEDVITNTFCDAAQFDDIMSNNKGAFIKKHMEINEDYRENVIKIFEEIVDRYCRF